MSADPAAIASAGGVCRRWALAPLLLAAAGTLAAAEPQDPPLEAMVNLSVAPEEITVGDPVTLILTVALPPGAKAVLPEPGPEWGPLTVRDVGTVERLREDNRHLLRRRVTATAFQTGELQVPPLPIRVTTASGAGTVESPVRILRVRSVLAGEEDTGPLADLKAPWSLPMNLWRWAWLAAVALGAAAAGWWWRRWRGRRAPPAAAAPPLPADEEALLALERLLAGPYLAQGRIKEFHVDLAEITKRYVGRRFQIPTRERTSDEVLAEAARAGVVPEHRRAVEEVLAACDGVKFARARPAAAACRGTAESARDLVRRTRPVPASTGA